MSNSSSLRINMGEKRRYLGKNLIEYEEVINADLRAAGVNIRIYNLVRGKDGAFNFDWRRPTGPEELPMTEEEKEIFIGLWRKYFESIVKIKVDEN